jgi:Mis12 protein
LKEYTNLTQGLASIESLFEHSIDKRFDKWEIFCLKNILRIQKKDVVLDHYKDLPDVTAEDERKLDDEIDSLRKQLISVHWINHRYSTSNKGTHV